VTSAAAAVLPQVIFKACSAPWIVLPAATAARSAAIALFPSGVSKPAELIGISLSLIGIKGRRSEVI
jgi:hypothetical protein